MTQDSAGHGETRVPPIPLNREEETMATTIDDDGIGLIEIVVAMFMLGLIAVAAVPLLITGLQASAKNSAITTATGMLTEQMTLARAAFADPKNPKCSELTAFVAQTPATIGDGAGDVLAATDTVVCPSTYPGTASYTVSVGPSGSSTILATASTLIFVSAS